MKILGIGTSHIGALVKGWGLLQKQFPDIQMEFMGSPSRRLYNASINNSIISNIAFDSSKGCVPVTNYDGFIIAGNLPAPRFFANIFKSEKYSRQFKGMVIEDIYFSSINYHVLKMLTDAMQSEKTIIQLSMPERRNVKLKLSEDEFLSTTQLMESTINRHGNVQYISQPRSTLNDHSHPIDIYYNDAVNIHGEVANHQSTASIGHLNAKGGELLLEKCLSFLSEKG